MAKRDYFPFYHSYLEPCRHLTDESFGRVCRALAEYSRTGARPEFTGIEALAFDFIASDIDKAELTYQKKCTENARNGKLGGRPKKQTDADADNPFL